MNEAELKIYRANTEAFIAADSLELVLQPNTLERTATGGRKMTPGAPRQAESFRLIPQSDVMPQVQTPDGVQLTPGYILMGRWDSLMARWDEFQLGDLTYQIISPIRPGHTVNSRYFTKGDVAVR